MDEQEFVNLEPKDQQREIDRLLDLVSAEGRRGKIRQALGALLFILLSVGAWFLLRLFVTSGSTSLILLGTIIAVGISVGTIVILYRTIRGLIS